MAKSKGRVKPSRAISKKPVKRPTLRKASASSSRRVPVRKAYQG